MWWEPCIAGKWRALPISSPLMWVVQVPMSVWCAMVRRALRAIAALAGFPLRIPLIDVYAVGAGGGSIAWIDRDGLMKVGPHSAGAHPGPACYGLGGDAATLTDANVCLGRLNALALLDGRMPIRADLARSAVAKLAEQLRLGVIETARGIVQVASANIVRAIRTVSVERGHDPSQFSLFAYGGAGPLHAVEVARELSIRRVIVPPNPGILCAEGLLISDLRMDFVKTILVPPSARDRCVFTAPLGTIHECMRAPDCARDSASKGRRWSSKWTPRHCCSPVIVDVSTDGATCCLIWRPMRLPHNAERNLKLSCCAMHSVVLPKKCTSR